MTSLQSIFSSSDFADEAFDRPRWAADGSFFTTLRKVKVELALNDSVTDLTSTTASASLGGATVNEILWHDPATGSSEVLVASSQLVPDGEGTPLAIDDYCISPDRQRLLIFTNSQRVWRHNTIGSYWVLSLVKNTPSKGPEQLGTRFSNRNGLKFATFSPNSRDVAYVFENNLYVENLDTHSIVALTADGNENVINGTFDWVYEEEFHLFRGFCWSPDGSTVAYWQLDQTEVPVVNLVNNTDNMYPRVIPIHYPKAGDVNSSVRIGVVSALGGSTTWLQIPGDSKDNYLVDLTFHKPTGSVVVQQLNRLQNHLKIFFADLTTGSVVRIFEDKDEAWIDVSRSINWIENGQKFLFLTDRNGWRQLCLVSLGEDARRAESSVEFLTPTGMDVLSLEGVDEELRFAYYLAAGGDPLRRYLFRVGFDGTCNSRITPETSAFSGTNTYDLSNDGKYAVHCFSSQSRPSAYSIVSLPGHTSCSVLASNERLQAKFDALECRDVEFFQVDVGVDETSGSSGLLDCYCIKPPSWTEGASPRSYPVLFYVYGEPAAQIVRDQWGGRLGLWHRMLARRGTFVICIDNRGTPCPRGRAFRKCVYRQIGILSSADQALAAKTILESRPYLDPERVGVWGWSGGGSMTLNLMFKSPEIYGTGISVAPVPDMRCYDTIYQERYMGLPVDNEDGYRIGSPVFSASGLRESQNLLLIHGTGDDNCHYATTERLINELIRLNKPFQMMAYPNRSHSISEGANTSRHLFELITRFLTANRIVGHESSPAMP